MKIIYPNNNATLVPLRITGKAIEITQWLRGEQYVPYLKSVFAFNTEITKEDDEELTFQKRQEEADDADRGEKEDYYQGE